VGTVQFLGAVCGEFFFSFFSWTLALARMAAWHRTAIEEAQLNVKLGTGRRDTKPRCDLDVNNRRRDTKPTRD
jgi:hypothetical protein